MWASGDGGSIGSTGGEYSHTLSVDEMPSHNHSARIGSGAYGGVALALGDGLNTQYGWTLYGGNPIINASGGNAAHNNIPPFTVVNMWRRIG